MRNTRQPNNPPPRHDCTRDRTNGAGSRQVADRAMSLLAVLAAYSALASGGCTGTIVDASEDCARCGRTGQPGDASNGVPSGAGGSDGPANPPSESGTNIDPGLGNPRGIEGIGWSTRVPRLSHVHWENTVRDLLRLPELPGVATTFSVDPDDARFDNFGARIVSSNLWSDYQRGAESVAAEVARDPAKLARLRPAGAADDSSAFVRELGRRAFRRPLTADEIATYVALFERGPELMAASDAYAAGAELVISALLQSVHFLYRVESSTEAVDRTIRLRPYEIATRLSYALWNTMPSDELLDAAEAGELATAESLAQWTRALLDDPRADDTLVAFHSALLNIAEYGTIAKNRTLFPTFTPELQPVLQDEARAFVREVTAVRDGGIAELLTSPFTFVNETTAPFYGVTGSFGPELRQVELDPKQRAGFLTHIGFLSKYGSQTQSHPILRGVHISLDFLCSDLPAPPPNIPALPAIEENQTNRQVVEQLTSVQPCSSCHEPIINPLGFAFEHYDAIGQWRAEDNGQPVDATASYLLDDVRVDYNGGVELSRLLAESMTVHRCYASYWLEYALGRPPMQEEAGSIQNIALVSASSSATLSDLLASITALETFRARAEEEVSP